MSDRNRQIRRRIYFYRIDQAKDILPVLPDDLARIANLPFTEEGRYLHDSDTERLCVWPDSLEFPLKLRFGRTRLENLPTKEEGGKLEGLGLNVGAGLAELSHIVIFSDGYVAAEFNFEAPRIKRLGAYLYAKKNRLESKPAFLPLFQKDILKLVQNMPVINFLELRGKPDARYLLTEADEDLGSAYGTLGGLGADKAIQLGLRAQKKPDAKLKKLSTTLAKFTQRNPMDVHSSLTKLKITGINSEGRIDEVDLLEDHLIVTKQFDKLSKKDKAIVPESAYSQMISAYEERKAEFNEAIVGRIFN